MKLFGIPIKIEISFFVLAAFLAWSRISAPALLLEWLLVVFFSILLHELGHALAARAFGLSPTIRLYAMGGLTAYRSDAKRSVAKQLVISFSGPAIGFLAGAGVFLLGSPLLSTHSDLLITTYHDLLWVNVGWGLFNVLPMLPLDGGQALVAVEEGLLGRKDQVIAHTISLMAALAITFWALSARQSWIAFLGFWFAYSNGSFLFQTLQLRRDRKLESLLTGARNAVNQQQTTLGLELIEEVRRRAGSPHFKSEAARIFIVALIQQGKYEEAQRELQQLAILFGFDPYLEGLVHFQKGDLASALPHLRAAFNDSPGKEVGLMLNKALLSGKELGEALELYAHPSMAAVKWELAVNLQAEAFNQNDFETSIKAGLFAFALQPDPAIAYNIGCAFVRQTNLEEAFKWIKCAADSGCERKDLASDTDLDPLRSMPKFQQLLAGV